MTMISATQSIASGTETAGSMTPALIGSSLFHLALLVVVTVGLPFVARDDMISPPPITVDIVDVSEIRETNKPAPPQNKQEEQDRSENIPEQTPQMTAEAPPDLSRPAPPEIEEIPEAEAPAPPAPIERPVKKPDPPPQKPEPPQQQQAQTAPKQDDRFSSLLRNLAPDAKEAPSEDQDAETNEATQSQPSQIARLSDRLTMSEQDAVRRQLAQCWNVLAGAEYAENLAVELRVFMNPDRTVRQAAVMNQIRYATDQTFRAAADAALRALRNPRCSPLNLPPEKYEQWEVFVIRFDPQDML